MPCDLLKLSIFLHFTLPVLFSSFPLPVTHFDCVSVSLSDSPSSFLSGILSLGLFWGYVYSVFESSSSFFRLFISPGT